MKKLGDSLPERLTTENIIRIGDIKAKEGLLTTLLMEGDSLLKNSESAFLHENAV